MKKILTAIVLGGCMLGQVTAQEPKKGLGPVGVLQGMPIDGAFEKGGTEKQMTEALLNDKVFKAAIKAALAAKMGQEEMKRKKPGIAGPSPAQAARVKFLETLEGKLAEEMKGAEKK